MNGQNLWTDQGINGAQQASDERKNRTLLGFAKWIWNVIWRHV